MAGLLAAPWLAQTPAPPSDVPSGVYAPILMYHHIAERPEASRLTVSPAVFTAQMQWLKDQHFRVLSLDEWYDTLAARHPLPAKAVVITFDDGWRDQQVNALPVLVRFGYPATFYVITSCVGAPSYATWDMLRDARTRGMTIGSHTVTHPKLTNLAPRDIQRELVDSQAAIERQLGTKAWHFAYPDGLHTAGVVDAVIAAGYRTAVTTAPAAYQQIRSGRDYYTLTRVEADDDLASFIRRLAPSQQEISPLARTFARVASGSASADHSSGLASVVHGSPQGGPPAGGVPWP